MRRNLKTWLVVSMFLLAIGSAASGKTIYVDVDRPPGGGGTSWDNAYNYLQDALADANSSAKPVEIRVAQGTYMPDCNSADPNGSGDRTATFGLINGVTLKGGYAGFGEADPNARDISNNVTTLSGDLDGNDVPVATSDLLTNPNRAENSCHVVSAIDVDANTVFDGFTIMAGNANGAAYPDNAAGGMDSDNSTVTLLNCTFTHNSGSGYYGAMKRWDDLDRITEISNCNFTGNYTGSGDALGGELMILTNCQFNNNYGTGLYLYNGCSVTDCVFSGNTGGGMSTFKGSPILTNCAFVGNSGGGLYLSCNSSNNPEVTNCIFIDNSFAGNGAGMYISGGGESRVTNCTFIGNSAGSKGGGMFSLHFQGTHPRVTNCIFSGNTASGDGGAVCSAHDYTTFTNCSFSANQAGGDGGVYCCFDTIGSTVFNNCILWGNTASGEGPEIAVKVGTLTVDYSNVQGGKLDIYDPYEGLVWYDANNINSDPCFVDADGADDTAGTEDDDLHLLWDSPCINVGDPCVVFDVNERDIDDEPRVMVGRIDMGADEVGEKQADFTRNGRIDFEDLGIFVQSWLANPADINWYILCDLIDDEQIDFKDYADFATDYLWQAGWYEP